MYDDSSSLGRALMLVRVLDEYAPASMSLAALTERTGIPKSSVRRTAEALVAHGVLNRDVDGYGFGDGNDRVLRRLRAASDDRQAMRSHLAAALRTTQAACVWLIDVSEPRRFRMLDLVGRPGVELGVAGRNWPGGLDDPTALASGLGRMALSILPADEIDRRCSQRLQRLTPHTVTEPVQVARSVRSARLNGYEVESEEFRLGWACVTVAVRAADDTRMVLGAVGEVEHLDIAAVLPHLLVTRDALQALDRLSGRRRER